MIEEWREIPEYEGHYLVSNCGRVKSLYWNKPHGRMLSQKTDKDGYKEVSLHKNGKQTTKKVHRLVAEMFICNDDNLPQVNHIDEKKDNNLVTNLEWVTAKENVNHGTAIERMVNSKNGRTFIVDETGKVYKSQSECARDIGSTQQSVYKVLNGIYKTTCGFHIRYIREPVNDTQ